VVEFALLCCVLDPMWSFSFLCVCLCYHRMCGSVVGAVILRLQGAGGVVSLLMKYFFHLKLLVVLTFLND